MEEKEIDLRQASNEVFGQGYLQDFDLEYATTQNNVVIKGSVTMAVDEKRAFRLPIYTRKTTKDGEDSKTFIYLDALIREKESVDSIVNIMKEDKDKKTALNYARKIQFNGSVEPYGYINKEGSMVFPISSKKGLNVRVNSLGSAVETAEKLFEPKVKFNCEMFINKMEKEKVEDVETGRGLITTTLPLYGGDVATLNLVVLAPARDQAFGLYSVNDTAKLSGYYNLDIEVVSQDEEEETSWGWGEAPEKRVTTRNTYEMVLTGGSNPYGAQNEKAYKREDIDIARAEKFEKLQKNNEEYLAKKESQESTPAPKKGFKFE